MKLKRIIKTPFIMIKRISRIVLNKFNPPIIVLIYHRVTNLHSDPQLLAASPENFKEQVKFLKENYNILRFEEDWSTVREPSVVITFDDGYADNYLEALPILEELKVPATIFVSSGLLGTDKEYWWDELERVILMHESKNKFFELEYNGITYKWNTTSYELRKTMYNEIHPILKGMNAKNREENLNRLRIWAETDFVGRKTHRSLNKEELIKLAQSPWITIGAHTINHSSLSALSREEQEIEIFESKQKLEKIIGKTITVFSYPFGGNADYNKDSIEILKEAGIEKSASNFQGQWRKWTNSYEIPRQLVRNWNRKEFEKKMERFWYI